MGTLKRGAKVGKVRIARKIGEGQFAEVYRAYHKDLKVAVKVDKDTVVKSLNREIQVLKRLQNKTYFCKIYDCGKIDDGRSFCVMELLGCNLAKWKQDKKLELHEILKICRELLLAIREMHINGYVHRDIKPANFARRVQHKSDWSTWALFDFGLGRRIVGRDEEMLKERIGIGFRGSVSYASVNAHEQKDLSFRDDLWSWMYIMIELLKGDLPWKILSRGKDATGAESKVANLKRSCQDDPGQFFAGSSPIYPQIKDINNYLRRLKFGEMPNYSFLEDLLNSMNCLDSNPAVSKWDSHQGLNTGSD